MLTRVAQGTCSFCGKDHRLLKALIGSDVGAVVICDRCLGLAAEAFASNGARLGWRCDFCGGEVPVISGPRVFICERCVVAGATSSRAAPTG